MFLRLRTYSILSPSVNGLVLHLSCNVLPSLNRAQLVPEVNQRRGLYIYSLLTGCNYDQTNLREKVQNNGHHYQ